MRDRGAAVRRRRLARRTTAAVLVTVVTAGCTGSDRDDAQPPSSSPTATPLSEVDLTGVVVDRGPFCDALEEDAVAEVLGGEPEARDSYASGDRTELAPGLRDVANEFSCSFERGSGPQLRTARAWLFAQAVPPARARGWVEERRDQDGCREAGELAFGKPGLVQSCGSGERRRVTAVGLFGDGWLTCQATAPVAGPESLPEDTLLEATQRWCAEVAPALTPTP